MASLDIIENDSKQYIVVKIGSEQYGIDITNRLIAAINLLEGATNLKDILAFKQYKLHALKGNREGEYSIYLGKTTGFRLILIPLDENEKVITSNDMSIYTISVCVEIVEVSKHYEWNN